MKEYYLIPKEDIDNLEYARVDLWDILKMASVGIRARTMNEVTNKIYAMTHKKYESIEK